ncbi:hypothetical protein JCM11251_001686 [Rhodosporidiobolus azoricus]
MLSLRVGGRALLTSPSKRRCLSSSPSSIPNPLELASRPNEDPRPPYQLLFFGADSFSCRVLERVHEAGPGLVDQITVVTPGDQRVGRKLKELHRPHLRKYAEELDLPVIPLPTTLLRGWQPPEPFLAPANRSPPAAPSPHNLLLTASFGHLIPSSLLSHFRPLNALNVHPSLLPKYRGASPIQYGIINGDSDDGGAGMGVSVQELSRGKFDQGRILGQTPVAVPSDSSFHELEPILARAGGDLLVSILRCERLTIRFHHSLRDVHVTQAAAFPQDPSLATLAPKLHKHDLRAQWTHKTPEEIIRLQRGAGHQYPLWTTYTPRSSASSDSSSILNSSSSSAPPISTPLESVQLQLILTPFLSPLPLSLIYSPPGSAALDPETKTVVVKCRDSAVGVEVKEVKKSGGKWVGGREWWNGLGKRVREEGMIVFE